jgi:uncharacterized membrane protein
MSATAAITIGRPREEVERLWSSSEQRPQDIEAARFEDAPGDRGTEVHVELRGRRLGVRRSAALARVKNHLRRFKQELETGEIPRSEATPEGERFTRKLRQRPAQPVEREEVGAR